MLSHFPHYAVLRIMSLRQLAVVMAGSTKRILHRDHKHKEFTHNCKSIVTQMAPVYLTVMSDPVSVSASRSHLRSAARGDLAVPRSRTTTYGQRSFSVSGPSLWNSLPLSVRDPSLTMTQFCTHLKTFLFRRAYCT